jgi:hypothetical protein
MTNRTPTHRLVTSRLKLTRRKVQPLHPSTPRVRPEAYSNAAESRATFHASSSTWQRSDTSTPSWPRIAGRKAHCAQTRAPVQPTGPTGQASVARINLQDHHFFAHRSHSCSAIACMKRATSWGALGYVYNPIKIAIRPSSRYPPQTEQL